MLKEEMEVESNRRTQKDYRDPDPVALLSLAELGLWSFYRALIAEFMATFFLLFVAVSAATNNRAQTAVNPCGGIGELGVAWTVGGTIFVLVYCTAGISGGHMNPAVTFAVLLAQQMTLLRAVSYMLVQCLGAIAGVAVVDALMNPLYAEMGGAANEVQPGFSTTTCLVVEIITTFFLVYVLFSAIDPKRNARDSFVPVLAPLPVGIAVLVLHCATMPISGTGINPARSLGTAFMYNNRKAWDDHWIYWVGPLLGSTGATIYHKFVLRAGAYKALESIRGNPETK